MTANRVCARVCIAAPLQRPLTLSDDGGPQSSVCARVRLLALLSCGLQRVISPTRRPAVNAPRLAPYSAEHRVDHRGLFHSEASLTCHARSARVCVCVLVCFSHWFPPWLEINLGSFIFCLKAYGKQHFGLF